MELEFDLLVSEIDPGCTVPACRQRVPFSQLGRFGEYEAS